jgi:hypothetical protein
MQIKNIQEAINMANEIERYEGALKQMKVLNVYAGFELRHRWFLQN